nr:PREDICTED: lactosylceramide 4-alpha-galactosyltransferase-like [Bemisia tabaci]
MFYRFSSVYRALILVFVMFCLFFYMFANIKLGHVKPKKHRVSRDKGYQNSRAPWCYKLPQEDDEILDISDYPVKPNSIFFVETSCRHGNNLGLTVRQACTYESTARAHPNSEILILFPAPVFLGEDPLPHIKEVLSLPNLKLLRVNVERYMKDTPLENFDFVTKMGRSKFSMSHASDYLRFVTLWKYGGTYLDSDFIVIRPLNSIDNFIAAEDENRVNVAVLNVNISSEIGKYAAEEFLKESIRRFNPREWAENGPGSATGVIKRICKETRTRRMTREKCKGFTVYTPPPESPFYPTALKWRFFFNEWVDWKYFDKIKRESIALHMLGHLSDTKRIKKGARKPYDILAREFCPKVYATIKKYY